MKAFKVAAFVAGMAVASLATADIDFEGLSGGAVPAGYAGMNWSSDFYNLDGTNYSTDSGYKVLGTQIGFNAFASSPIWFESQDSSKFDILCVDSAAAWRNWVDVRFDGYNDGGLVYSTTHRITADVRNTIALNYLGIDRLEMHYVGDSGTNYWTGGDGTHVAYDNFKMIPAPGALAFLGLGGLTFVGRRRRN